ncbi:MAG: heat-inducible transcriptional repressor HrcA [Bacteroidetes bacterium]|nr:heat-inducible transcriptional repressor HrcA [Bacteroidota bacterium]
MLNHELSHREKTILKTIISSFIKTATPVGSSFISKKGAISWSAATIRNVMSDLEDEGLINHPHTSAGRVPTDKGYRFFVNTLMQLEDLTNIEKDKISTQLGNATSHDDILIITSKLISEISNQLGVVTAPNFIEGILEKIELISLSSTKLMVILSIKSGLVKTIMMEVSGEVSRDNLNNVSTLLNEKLSGLTLKNIKETFSDRLRDSAIENTGLIRMFIESSDKIFEDSLLHSKMHLSGTHNLLNQKEFNTSGNYRSIIELINQDDMIIHLLQKNEVDTTGISVTIGSENQQKQFQQLSILKTEYKIGTLKGQVGIIGNKRMDYPKLIPLVNHISKTITEMFNN